MSRQSGARAVGALRLAAGLAAAALLCGRAAAALTWEEAESAGLRIAAVRVEAADVFDPARPDERHALARAANAVHVTTRERVVRGALLFGAGDRADAARVRESERRLRALPWLIDAAIEPRPAAPGLVDAVVRTHDGWSLSLGLKYRHVGGDAVWRASVDEDNLLGLGTRLAVTRERDLDRETTELAWGDPLLFGTPWALEAELRDHSDGSGRHLKIARPFHELAAPWAAGVEALAAEVDVERFQGGGEAYRFPARLRDVRLHWRRLVRLRDRTAWRLGLELLASTERYGALEVLEPRGVPEPDLAGRRVRALLAVAEVSQDRWATFRNLRSVASTEDVNLGWDAILKAGWMGRALGGDRDGWLAEGLWRAGRRLGTDAVLVHEGEARGRMEGGGLRDALVRARQGVSWQGLPLQTVAAGLDLAWSRRLDPEHALYLGAFEGLRGYPNRFRSGERSWLLSVEDRLVTPWRLWGIAQLGFVAYADAGAIAGQGAGFGRTWADVGAGLHLGNLKGTLTRVVQLTLAVPLVRDDGVPRWQVLAGNTVRF